MSGKLHFRNRQRFQKLNLRLFSKALYRALRDLLNVDEFDIVFLIVGEREMTRLNETYLKHAGSTDVITFDYANDDNDFGFINSFADKGSIPLPRGLHGEIFICIHEAHAQSKRFRTDWQSELLRYAVHGVLHLLGFDDTTEGARKKMKREEDRVMKELALQFYLKSIGRKSTANSLQP